MEYDIPPEGEEVQRRVYEALLPYVGKPMTPEITEIIKQVLSQAAQDGLLEPYHDRGEQ
jgi:hypothetical protein